MKRGGTKLHQDGVFSEYFDFTSSVSFHRRSLFVLSPTMCNLIGWYVRWITHLKRSVLFRRVCRIAEIDISFIMSVRPSVRMERLGPNSKDFHEILRLWGNVEKYGRAWQATDDDIIQRMSFAFWITKATDPDVECVILIAFPRQQWLRERHSVLRSYVHFQPCLCLFVWLF